MSMPPVEPLIFEVYPEHAQQGDHIRALMQGVFGELGLDAHVVLAFATHEALAQAGVSVLPAVRLDGETLLAGRVPEAEEISEWVRELRGGRGALPGKGATDSLGPLRAGDQVGGYAIIELIGAGGMGAVYRARDESLRRDVAIKVLNLTGMVDGRAADRFVREAQTAAALEHPNILPVYQFGVTDGRAWIAMRLVEGGSLRDQLDARRLSREMGLRVLEQVADALDYAHSRRVVHRDVKPENVLISADDHVYLADFGLARVREGNTRMTMSGAFVGTPAYASPEQVLAEREIDGRSDIYSLAVMAHEILTGTLPFQGASPTAVAVKQVGAAVPEGPLRHLPRGMAAAILRGLAKRPEQRWREAGSFGRALRSSGLGEHPHSADSRSGAKPATKAQEGPGKRSVAPGTADKDLLKELYRAAQGGARKLERGVKELLYRSDRLELLRGIAQRRRLDSVEKAALDAIVRTAEGRERASRAAIRDAMQSGRKQWVAAAQHRALACALSLVSAQRLCMRDIEGSRRASAAEALVVKAVLFLGKSESEERARGAAQSLPGSSGAGVLDRYTERAVREWLGDPGRAAKVVRAVSEALCRAVQRIGEEGSLSNVEHPGTFLAAEARSVPEAEVVLDAVQRERIIAEFRQCPERAAARLEGVADELQTLAKDIARGERQQTDLILRKVLKEIPGIDHEKAQEMVDALKNDPESIVPRLWLRFVSSPIRAVANEPLRYVRALLGRWSPVSPRGSSV